MALWGNTDAASNSTLFAAAQVNKTPNTANRDDLFGNTDLGAYVSGAIIGQFGVDTTEQTFNNLDAHAGWVLRKAGTGPVISATGTGGDGIANGETVTVSNGSSNATLVLTSNATANIASVTVLGGGAGFTVPGETVITFNREQHLVSILFDEGTYTTGIGPSYDNTDIIVASNGTVNAVATITTDASGNVLLSSDFLVTTVGLFANTLLDTEVDLAITNSSFGTAAGNADVSLLSANITPSTGGSVTVTLGGRAGRVHWETLVAMGSIGGDASDDAILPDA